VECLFCGISSLCNVLSAVYLVCGIYFLWFILFGEYLVCGMYFLWNILPVEYFVCGISCLWMSFLWDVLSVEYIDYDGNIIGLERGKCDSEKCEKCRVLINQGFRK
jgi:hypothetical protein